MSYYDIILQYDWETTRRKIDASTEADVERALSHDRPSMDDFAALVSPAADKYLNELAAKSYRITRRRFGNTMQLYIPLYLANICQNHCVYCGYNCKSGINRRKLNMEQIKNEADYIADMGFKHILVLTGESERHSPVEYIGEAVKIISDRFASIGIEVYPREVEGYRHLVENGADSLTVYQETYDEVVYKKVHIKGPKANFKFRLDAPERGAKAGMRSLSIGALLGLADYRKDAFFTILHGEYLKTKYPHIELSYSAPRMKPFKGSFEDINPVDDPTEFQIMTVMRLFDPHAALNVSTRENLDFRKHVMPLGVTKLSAEVTTDVGGHTLGEAGTNQFENNTDASLEEVGKMLNSIGYQYVFKDWERF